MTKPRITTDETFFFVDLRGEGWGVLFAFPQKELEKGASLARMMNEKVRATLKANGAVISASEIKEVARNALDHLRPVVERHFAPRR